PSHREGGTAAASGGRWLGGRRGSGPPDRAVRPPQSAGRPEPVAAPVLPRCHWSSWGIPFAFGAASGRFPGIDYATRRRETTQRTRDSVTLSSLSVGLLL